MTFGERVKRYRLDAGFTQQELADRCGWKSKSSINKIELGIQQIDQRKIAVLAGALGISPECLFFDSFAKEDVEKDILWQAFSQLNAYDRKTIFMLIQRLSGVEVQGDM